MEKFLTNKKKDSTTASPATKSTSGVSANVNKCPGCNKSVNFAPDKMDALKIQFSHSVDCGHGHFFCWQCRALIGHAPVSCLLWEKWQEKCAKMDNSGFFAFLISHARPCPHCGQNLQKVDGCNKVKCGHCAQEFCWICLENWKKHPMCNRYVEVGKIEMRFIHFYIRYRNHYNSYQMEKDIVVASDHSR